MIGLWIDLRILHITFNRIIISYKKKIPLIWSTLEMFNLLLITCILVYILFDVKGYTESDHICNRSNQEQKPRLHQHESSPPLQSAGSTFTLQVTLGIGLSHMTWTPGHKFHDFGHFNIYDLSIMIQKLIASITDLTFEYVVKAAGWKEIM